MEISSNLTLELLDKPFLLEKRIELLFAIQRCGSINKAAKEVPMSYKKAWEAVDIMNNLSSHALVTREKGGKGGGGTSLTKYGENLLKTYLFLKQEQKSFLNRLKEMTDIDTGTLKTIGRLAMQISARNQIQGIVDSIIFSEVSSQINVKLKSGNTLVSNITKTAAKDLGIKKGEEVTAFFKSSNVLISVDLNIALSARNKFEGKVISITEDKINSELIIDIGNADSIVSVITTSSIKSLGLKEGMVVCAIIKSSDIMIGK
ncbi:MAG: TOBE domain-containing protein [Halarcobacter sp.]